MCALFDALLIEIDGGEANCVVLDSSNGEVWFEVCRHTGPNQQLKQPDKMGKYFPDEEIFGIFTESAPGLI